VRRLGVFLLMSLVVILQVSFLPAVRPFGVVPNIALVMMVLVSLSVVTSEALIVAALSGLVLDLASGSNFGLWTGVMMLIALVVGMMQRAGLELDRMFVALVLVAAGTAVIALVIWTALFPSVAHWPAVELAGRLAIELVINLVLTILLWSPVRLLLGGSGPRAESGG
jgi:rod shape-determining protein MreD